MWGVVGYSFIYIYQEVLIEAYRLGICYGFKDYGWEKGLQS